MAEGATPSVAIIGAGMSGLCMASKLLDAGIDTFTVFESADEVGGTWRDNTYPGLHCDVPSRFYSYSFGLNAEWSRFMSPGPGCSVSRGTRTSRVLIPSQVHHFILRVGIIRFHCPTNGSR